jgi:hypothetical protein
METQNSLNKFRNFRSEGHSTPQCKHDSINCDWKRILRGWGLIIIFWLFAVWFINPLGDFHINDDWAFYRSLERFLSNGEIMGTGWGPAHASGGPSLFTHLLWGALFAKTFGLDPATLRISEVVLGLMGCIGMFALVFMQGRAFSLSLLCAFALAANPLYLSQSFTYMSDVPFTALLIWSLVFIGQGIKRSSYFCLVMGLILSLMAILTRQVGIVLPMALIIASLFQGRSLGLNPFIVVGLTLIIATAPWVCYEILLFIHGGDSIVRHQVFHNILRYPLEKGPLGYSLFIMSRLFLVALPYICFFALPVIILRIGPLTRSPYLRRIGLIILIFTGMAALGDLLNFIHIPVIFYQNVIYDLGIGPLLFKDTYILGIDRSWSLPGSLYALLVAAAAFAVISMAFIIHGHYKAAHLIPGEKTPDNARFIGELCLIAMLLYLGIILLTGFHDRYLIAPVVFLLVFLALSSPMTRFKGSVPMWLVSVALIGAMAVFSVTGVRDFMEIKRAQARALNHITGDLDVEACAVDGGFEFNGYYCYDKDYERETTKSWWWVQDERYAVTLGPLPGYEVVKKFPYRRIMGPDSAVFALKKAP